MTDKEIIDGLIHGDESVSRQFYFENCRPLFTSIINRVFPYHVEYDEFVNELYLYLMEDDAAKLKQFEGRSSIYQWLKTIALRYALRMRKQRVVIETETKEPPYIHERALVEEPAKQSKMDLNALLARMDNERYVYLIRRHLIEGLDEPTLAEEMDIKVSNLYNIKKRAMTALTKVALTDIQLYGKTSN